MNEEVAARYERASSRRSWQYERHVTSETRRPGGGEAVDAGPVADDEE
jgi:hypothetical protein